MIQRHMNGSIGVDGLRRCFIALLALLHLCWEGLAVKAPEATVADQTERNNWAVLVDTSRYWYNYRHVANVLSFYHTIKRLGIPDSQIILMMAEDMPCNPRNSRPGQVFNEMYHHQNLYGEDVEVDYRGDEVSVENFLRLLTGRHPPSTARSKRLLTDSMSNIFIFITGHSGEEFIKFQDWEEITSNDIADGFKQMHAQQRYKKIFWVSDTCQAATLQNQFESPNIIAFGSSGKKENSYSHHVDHELGVAVIDRFTYYALEFLNRLTTSSGETLESFRKWFKPSQLHSNPEMRSDLFTQTPEETLITEFLASTGRMRFQSNLLPLTSDPQVKALLVGSTSAVMWPELLGGNNFQKSLSLGTSAEVDSDVELPQLDLLSWLARSVALEQSTSVGQKRLATTFKEQAEAQVWGGRLGTGPLILLPVFAFAGLAQLASIVL